MSGGMCFQLPPVYTLRTIPPSIHAQWPLFNPKMG
jgi:hypothetical protein